MRLKRLWIDGFKNLNNFELNFENNNGITVLIGNNGSGKSNVLEAISAIFNELYNITNPRRKKVEFDYQLEYTIESNLVQINVISEESNNTYNFELRNDEEFVTIEDPYKLKNYLPNRILMLYSGEDLRIKKKYYDYFRTKYQRELREAQYIPELPKMLYIDKFFWTISLLSLLLSEENENFCKKILKVNDLNNVNIYFKFNTEKFESQDAFFLQLSNGDEEINLDLSAFKFYRMIPSARELFVQLTGLTGQYNKVTQLKIYVNGVDTIFLSEGEKKQILLKAALEVLADENTLVLMDEPDANIHVANKVQIKTMLEEYPNRENIITTHSPTLTHSFDDKHINMIIDGKIEDKIKQDIFAEISDGIWNYQEQNIFLSSTKDIILLVEGKHDKIHIEEAFRRLVGQYNGLEFDVFFADGANNLKQLVLGFSTSDFDLGDRKIIAIFDDDDDGRKGRSQQNFEKVNDKIYHLKSNKRFYGILLPKQENFSGEFTIENMYPPEKFKEAMEYAFENRKSQNDFFYTGINEISKKIREDAKNRLADQCVGFNDDDFKHFKELFNLIKEINELQ